MSPWTVVVLVALWLVTMALSYLIGNSDGLVDGKREGFGAGYLAGNANTREWADAVIAKAKMDRYGDMRNVD